MSYIKAVEKHKNNKKKKDFIDLTEEPKLPRHNVQQTHDEFLSEQMKKGAEEVMTDGLFTKFAGEKDFFSDEPKSDSVNSPPHYNQYDIECIDAIQAATANGFQFYLQGNILKYLWRYNYKNGIEDLNKAQWYLNKLLEVKNGNKS